MVDAIVEDRYAGERTVPKFPSCMPARFRLIFDGRSLRTIWTRKLLIFNAVSGRPDAEGRFDYSPARQRISNEGPIPEGEYWINPEELQDNAWWRFRNPRDSWGDHWITIHPYPYTETFSRGGFFIHGGSEYGSAGCIDLASNMRRFVKALKSEIGEVRCFIPLEVEYTR
jgi:hypothetical protein